MMWQAWIAFGTMLGFIIALAVYYAETSRFEGLNWRLMLASVRVTYYAC